MNEDKLKLVLNLYKDGKVTVDEAVVLLKEEVQYYRVYPLIDFNDQIISPTNPTYKTFKTSSGNTTIDKINIANRDKVQMN